MGWPQVSVMAGEQRANRVKTMRLIPITVFACATNLCSFCQAQTNTCPGALTLFSQPPVQLRQESSPPPATKSSTSLQRDPPALTALAVSSLSIKSEAKAELCSTLQSPELHGSFVRSDVFYLTRNEPPQFNNPVNKFVDQVFRPEVFHIGKRPATCSIWTAIKRKNPLCLLNPLVFQASW